MQNLFNDLDYHQKQYRIAVIAPAGAPRNLNALSQLKTMCDNIPNIELHVPEGLLDRSYVPYHANSDEARFQFLKMALEDDAIDIIWCLGGGYGTARLLPILQDIDKPKQHKLVIGYSDITALHLFLAKQWGWSSIHGGVLAEIWRLNERDSRNFQKIFDFLAGKHDGMIVDDLLPLNTAAQNVLQCYGTVVGGNLALCQTSIGTAWALETKGRIVMLEDTHEDGYAVDRTLYHLRDILDDAAAIVLGCFNKGDNNLEFALQRFADEMEVPVFKSNGFGHDYHNMPFLHNVEGIIEAHDTYFCLTQPSATSYSIA